MSSKVSVLVLALISVGIVFCSTSVAQEDQTERGRDSPERWGPHPIEYVSVSSGLVAFTMKEMPSGVDYFRILLPEQKRDVPVQERGGNEESPKFDIFKLALSEQWPIAVYYDPAGGKNVEVTELTLAFSASADFTHVVTMDTKYYSIGPQQGTPPDGVLEAGTKVRLHVGGGSYVRVVTEEGVEIVLDPSGTAGVPYVRVVTEEGVRCFVAADALKKLDETSGDDDSENR